MQYLDYSPEQIEYLYTTFTYFSLILYICLKVTLTKNNSSCYNMLVKYLREVDQAYSSFIRSTLYSAIEDLLNEYSGY